VSRLKLVLMSLGTLGLYQIYWFYKHWKAMQAAGNKLNAPIRAVFYPFTAYWLFRDLHERAAAAGVEADYRPGVLAVALFAVYAVTFWLPDPWWLLGFITIALILPVQAAADRVNLKLAPGADPNARFSGLNIFGMVLGGLLLILGIVGSFLPPE